MIKGTVPRDSHNHGCFCVKQLLYSGTRFAGPVNFLLPDSDPENRNLKTETGSGSCGLKKLQKA